MNIQQHIFGQDSVKTLQISDDVFGCEYRPDLIHQAVVAYMARARQGSVQQKTRSDVRGGGIKPWRQKGTGRARAGTIRSPLWKGGGIIFAARPRDYTQKINKKAYQLALRSALSELVRQGRLKVVDDFKMDSPKTKAFLQKFEQLGVSEAIIYTQENEFLTLSSRNIPKIGVCTPEQLNIYDLVAFDHVIFTENALRSVESRFQ